MQHSNTNTLVVSWALMKQVKAFQFHYISRGEEPNPSYIIYGMDSMFCYRADVEEEADVTDFETNYQAQSVAVADEHAARALMEEDVNLTATVNTLASTKTTILSYTVPANKTLYVIRYAISRITAISIGADPATLEVNGTIKDQQRIDALSDAGPWYVTLEREWRLATGGQTVTLTVDPTGVLGSTWHAILRGVLR